MTTHRHLDHFAWRSVAARLAADPIIRYLAPSEAGYSIAMKPASLDEYEFPRGRAWA